MKIADLQQIAVLGAGRSGLAAASLACAHGMEVTVHDEKAVDARREVVAQLAAQGTNFALGPEGLERAEAVVVSPGIPPESSLVQAAEAGGRPLLGEVEFAWRLDPDPRVVALTGTNGKTTTTEMVQAIALRAGLEHGVGGNYGTPYSELVEHHPKGWKILEISSFQLERIERFHPQIAVWLNFAADHLDRYPDLHAYFQAKARLLENLGPDDLLILSGEIGVVAEAVPTVGYDTAAGHFQEKGGRIQEGEQVLGSLEELAFRGQHNVLNARAALEVARGLGVPRQEAWEALRTYRPPAHRYEWVRHFEGADYINDSKGTNPHALEKALLAEKRPTVLIAGGKDKGFVFPDLPAGGQVRAALLVGQVAEAVAGVWARQADCEVVKTIERAVARARELAQPGDRILLSPGTSSFDQFTGFEARGDHFRQLVASLI
ncbi:MAG: UDP-N-acetylmuramoyl-L-alanine--D-glutamate ligase [Verrucomicrobiota bacterium]